MSQKTVILTHLKKEPITQKTALYRYGVSRLADVVFKLKNDGHSILTEPVRVKTRYGKAIIARYHLESAYD